jgi:Pyruvate/2-oxoacid:ferredoxin oxidoreductase delta subunit
MFMTVTSLTVTCLILPCMMTSSSQLHAIKGFKSRVEWCSRRTDYDGDRSCDIVKTCTYNTKKWRLQLGVTNTRVHQFTDDKSGSRQIVAPHVNKDSTPGMFWCGMLQQLLLCWWNQPVGSVNSTWTHYKMDRLQYLMSMKLKCFVCGSYCPNGTYHTAHMVRWHERLWGCHWTVFIHYFMAKQMTHDSS